MEKDKLQSSLTLLATSSVIIFLGILFSKIFSYAYRIVIARSLGAEAYGRFSLALVIIGILVAVSTLGFNQGIVRYLAFYRGKKDLSSINFLFKTSSTILIFTTIFVAVISFISSEYISTFFFKDSGLAPVLRIFSIMLPFWVLAVFYLSCIRSFERIRALTLIEQIIQNGSKFIFLLFFILLGLGEFSIYYSFFLGILLMLICAYGYCRLYLPILFLRKKQSAPEQGIFSSFFSYSWPIMFWELFASIFYWIDSILLGYFKGTSEVGFYNGIVPIVLLLNFGPELFIQLFLPMITKKYSSGDKSDVQELSKQVAKWIWIFNLPLFFLIFFFPGVLINSFFGQEFLIAETSLRLLLIGTFFSSIALVSNNLIAMAGKSKLLMLDLVLAGLLNFALNLILIPKESIFGITNSSGLEGAAISTMISTIFFSILFFIQAKKHTQIIPIRRKMLNVLLSTFFPILFVFIFREFFEITLLTLILVSIIFVLLYTICLFLFNSLDRNDKFIFQLFLSRFKK